MGAIDQSAGCLEANLAALGGGFGWVERLERIVGGGPRPRTTRDEHGGFNLAHHRPLHDPRDPVAQARGIVRDARLESADDVVVFGFGAGHVIRAVLEQAAPAARVHVVVVDPACMIATLEQDDVSGWIGDPRLRLLAGDLREIVRAMPAVDTDLVVVALESTLALATPSLLPLVQMGRELSATQQARRSQQRQVARNIERNLAAILDALPAGRLVEMLAGQPILLVAPGPSLDSQLERLRDPARPFTVALDTSLRVLDEAGVRPDLAITLDATERNVPKFRGLRVEVPLLFFGGAYPRAVAESPRSIFACERDGLLYGAHEWFRQHGGFDSAGSVLHAAIDVLLAARVGTIGLVGADLAYSDGRGHAAAAARTRRPVATRRVAGKNGGEVETSESLWRHLQRISRRLQRVESGRVVDLGAAGACIPHAPRGDLDDWLREHRLEASSAERCEWDWPAPCPLDGARRRDARAAVLRALGRGSSCWYAVASDEAKRRL